jgi:sugar O-acyltransferase (sialic acid O-acetyltransferase NeuD family)
MPPFRKALEVAGERPDIVWVDDSPEFVGKIVNGRPVLSFHQLTSAEHRDRLVSVAIATPMARAKVVEKCEVAGLSFCSVLALDHARYDDVEIKEGAICCANTMITSNVRIGRHFHLNIYGYVAHDCVVGDFVTFAPGVRCNGRVHIDDFAYIGTNAVFKQGEEGKPLRVGKGAIVGMGAVVTKDVAAGVTVVGNPATPLKRTTKE